MKGSNQLDLTCTVHWGEVVQIWR